MGYILVLFVLIFIGLGFCFGRAEIVLFGVFVIMGLFLLEATMYSICIKMVEEDTQIINTTVFNEKTDTLDKVDDEYQITFIGKDGEEVIEEYSFNETKLYKVEENYRIEEIRTPYKIVRDCDKNFLFPNLWKIFGRDNEIISKGSSLLEYRLYVPKDTEYTIT